MSWGNIEMDLISEYLQLTKPRVVALLVFCAVIGMFLAVPGIPPWRALVFGTLGIWMASGSAAAFNHLIDERIDKLMARTARRPLATGKLTPRQVLVFAVSLGIASMLVLALLVNPLTALLTFGGLIGYALVYTAYLKRATPQNIVIGGLAGAIPPVLGWTAVTDALHPFALQLCLSSSCGRRPISGRWRSSVATTMHVRKCRCCRSRMAWSIRAGTCCSTPCCWCW